MAIKLFTIGDSISQGFMSGAAASTELSYSTLLAKSLGIEDYSFHQWAPDKRLKVDLERILRKLERKYGSDIRRLEWPFAISSIDSVLDHAEDYFERGEGRVGTSLNLERDIFDNVAVEGMDVGDVLFYNAAQAKEAVDNDKSGRKDSFYGIASQSFARNAYRILNPNAKPEHENKTPLDWLKHQASNEGVENTIVWLGANNALGTVLDLKVKPTPGDGETVLKTIEENDRATRSNWNLWMPIDFEAEYKLLMAKLEEAMAQNQYSDWRVFLGTVPLVTIAPLARGIGERRERPCPTGSGKNVLYYQYYTYFPFSEETALKSGKYLKYRDALFIDKTIVAFNKTISKLAEEYNLKLGREAFHVVDLSSKLTDMAWKRNLGAPTYEFPDYFNSVYPPVDTKYYHANEAGEIEKGGIFSLDGVHPSAIGQGLIAWEVLKVMQEHGRAPGTAKIDWPSVFASDTLRLKPITLMHEIYQHDDLIKFVLGCCSLK